MAGEAYDDDRKGAADEFLSHPKWHRFLVAIAGPFMNVLLAVFVWTFAYMEGVDIAQYIKGPAVIGYVETKSIANQAGLQPNDKILSVNGNAVNNWEQMEIALGTSPKDSLNLQVDRNGQTIPIHLNPPSGNVESESLGFLPPNGRMVIFDVESGAPAQKAGMQQGDEILSIKKDGAVIGDLNLIRNTIAKSKGIPLDFEIRRPPNTKAGEPSILHLKVTPAENKNGQVLAGFRFGYDYPSVKEQFNLFGAINKSIHRNYNVCVDTFTIIGRIFKGTASIKTLSGPIEIAKFSGKAAQAAQSSGRLMIFFTFLALVSLQLGVFNLLPIPILDGGVMALLIIEGLMRRDLSLNVKEKIVQVGFVFLMLLMGFVIFNDLSKNISFHGLFR
jgi:regulator of sigma E protease